VVSVVLNVSRVIALACALVVPRQTDPIPIDLFGVKQSGQLDDLR
jgi:hypothetical protein